MLLFRFEYRSALYRDIRLTVLFGITLAIVLLLCSADFSTADDQTKDPGLRDVVERYRADLDTIRFRYQVPLSPRRDERLKEFWQKQQQQISKIDFDSLTTQGKVDHALLAESIRYEQANLVIQQSRDTAAMKMIPGVQSLVELLERDETSHTVEAKSVAEIFESVRRALSELPKDLQELRDKDSNSIDVALRFDALRAAKQIEELQRAMKEFHTFYSGYDPNYSWWAAEPFKQLRDALSRHEKMLREEILGIAVDDKDTIIGQPIGEAALQLELQHELIPYTPSELIQIAEEEFAWCDREMQAAAKEMGFDDWREAQSAVKNRYVLPGKQPELIKSLADEAALFVEQRDLLTVPPLCRESWRMSMMTPERQRVNPYFLGGDTIIVSYPTDAMTHEEKLMSMRGNNPHFARATVHHELIPGHYLQQFMTARYRGYRGLFNTPFWIEGWALYWEMLLWDQGFARSPEDRIGMLFWRKHRCARIIFSLKYHLGEMTPEQCVDFLVQRVGHERRNAAAEIRRSVMADYSPLYQAAYMLGGLQIRSLHRQLVVDGQWTNRQFHDAILRQGSIPITALRSILLDHPPTQEGFATWRFRGE
ncbi:DUF885 family protein [Stieleria varia]|uniref:X-Pro dipeptidyl-peptidase n=1 Tax=Stieleria varia TaxID=2528005 RepID=A0A5C6A3H3_9BACT|nr:DUF885 family protein [Stieleria varia]TWT93956.1 hypothetical protein Pla52n_57840 [Stieleria varia]